jgi:GMP synthase (glutamine-hydrolysing)
MIQDIHQHRILILDFGSQYTQLIARRVREIGVYCEIWPWDVSEAEIADFKPRGIILSGGPESATTEEGPRAPAIVFDMQVPVLGICYGLHTMAAQLGGRVEPSDEKEFGYAEVELTTTSALFDGLSNRQGDDGRHFLDVWMSHGDKVTKLPEGFERVARTASAPVCAIADEARRFYGVQFHPEVTHTASGKEILQRFVLDLCGCEARWTAANIIEDAIANVRKEVGSDHVLLGLSGGVDSSVVAALLHEAIGDQLTCIFVNNGLLRHEEADRTLAVFENNLGMNIVYVDATDRFLNRLAGVIDPEQKRKIIGEEFIRVFEEEANRIGKVDFLAQGTLYPDVIESISAFSNAAATIKSHHNVGGLPSRMTLKLLEPLRFLFKDEVRLVGEELGLDKDIVWRQPFPGPGLAIRCIGEVTAEKLEILRSADFILMNEIKKAKLYRQLWQTFCVLTDVRSVGVMGDFRTYSYLAAIRAVTSDDAMTADWARLPYDFLARVSNRIVNEVDGINRVVYDITSKPPSTIEWE